MSVKRNILIIACLFSIFYLSAQSISDYFHTAANYYIKGEKANAKKSMQDALARYPDDPKLKALSKKIDKLPDDKENKNQNNKDQQNQNQNNKDQQNQNQDKNKDQQKQDQDKKNQDKKDQKQQQQPDPNQMSKENAQQLLDAFLQDEKNTQDKMKQQQMKTRQKKASSKDW